MGEYELTKEKILAIVKECPQAEKPLKAAFPEAFKEKWVLVDCSRIKIRIEQVTRSLFLLSVMVDGLVVGELRPSSGLVMTSGEHKAGKDSASMYDIYEKK